MVKTHMGAGGGKRVVGEGSGEVLWGLMGNERGVGIVGWCKSGGRESSMVEMEGEVSKTQRCHY